MPAFDVKGCPLRTVLAFGLLASSLGVTAGNGLWAIERPQASFAADVCTLAVTLTAAFFLVYPLGAMGVAVAMLAGITAGTIVR